MAGNGWKWQAHTGPSSESCLGGGQHKSHLGLPGISWCRPRVLLSTSDGWRGVVGDDPRTTLGKLESCTEGSKGVRGRVLVSSIYSHPSDLPATCTAISTPRPADAGHERLHGHVTRMPVVVDSTGSACTP